MREPNIADVSCYSDYVVWLTNAARLLEYRVWLFVFLSTLRCDFRSHQKFDANYSGNFQQKLTKNDRKKHVIDVSRTRISLVTHRKQLWISYEQRQMRHPIMRTESLALERILPILTLYLRYKLAQYRTIYNYYALLRRPCDGRYFNHFSIIC